MIENKKFNVISQLSNIWKRIGSNNQKLIIVAVLSFTAMTVVAPGMFLSSSNLLVMGIQISEIGLFSICAMMIFVSGGFDLSTVAVANLTSILSGLIMKSAKAAGLSGVLVYLLLALCFVIALIVGGTAGAFNGLLISKFNISPRLATLGTMNLFMGMAIIISGGSAVSGFPSEITNLGNGSLLGIPVPLVLLIVMLIVTNIVLNKTKFGFELKFYGTNRLASMFSGIPPILTVVKTYMFSSIVAAITGIEMMARTNTAKADFGTSYLFISILCVILGGTNPGGGYGSIFGLILGSIILQIFSSGFNILHLSSVLKDFIWGALLLGVMVINHFIEQRKQLLGIKMAEKNK
jgi:Ribose/xylose/arabinose/galactoside ABC-type transport systems, permease components